MQNLTPPPPLSQSQSQSPQAGNPVATGINTFPGAIPTVDWGTFDMPSPMPVSSYSGISPTNYTSTLLPDAAQQVGDDTDSPQSVMYGGSGMMAGSTNGNIMDAVNDIDWVSDIFSSGSTNADNGTERCREDVW
jgi:hypothetical protein